MTRTMRPEDLIDSTVVDPQGSKIGKVGTVYLADDTRKPEWVTVKTGLFGHKETFVPLSGADFDQDGLHVQVAKDQVSDAPQMETDGHLSPQESGELYRYYGLPTQRDRTGEDARDAAVGTVPAGRDTRGMASGKHAERSGMDRATKGRAAQGKDKDSSGMIRSEERLNVGTEQVETGHVRLRKYVVTEEQQVTVPVTHEEVRIEREPITDGKPGQAELGDDEQEVILHAEKPVVSKESVPVERVRMGTEKVTEKETVRGEIRKEQIEVQDDSKHRKNR